MKATKTRRIKRKEDRDRRRDPSRQDTTSFLSSICTSASPDSPLRFALAIEEKCRSEILPLYLGFQAITGLPRDLITFLNEAGLSSLIKMIGPYYMLSQLKGQKSLVALEFCQISFYVSGFFLLPSCQQSKWVNEKRVTVEYSHNKRLIRWKICIHK